MKINNKNLINGLPDAILFDTDNTLYPYDIANIKAIVAVKEKVVKTFSITSNEFEAAFKEAKIQIKKRLKNTASSHSRLLYLQRMLEIMGLGSQVLLSLDLEQTYWRTFLTNSVLFDDVEELLEEIRLIGIPTAIVTDLTAQIQFRKMVYFNLDKYFDFIVTSEESGCDKPSSSSFNLAIDKINPKGSIFWMIGDNYENDILGAKHSINAITFHKVSNLNKDVDKNSVADAVFDSYKEFLMFFKSISK